MKDQEFWAQVVPAIDARLAKLELLPVPDLSRILDDTSRDTEVVAGRPVTFTKFACPKSEREVVVAIEAGVPAFLGLGRKTFLKGFVKTNDGRVRPATSEEIDSTL